MKNALVTKFALPSGSELLLFQKCNAIVLVGAGEIFQNVCDENKSVAKQKNKDSNTINNPLAMPLVKGK